MPRPFSQRVAPPLALEDCYRVGAHRGLRMPGAFRQQEPLWVIRSSENLTYSTSDSDDLWDDLDGQLPFDDIHWTFFSPTRSRPPYFSSAGCQTISAWGPFRESVGLIQPPQILNSQGATSDDGKEFQYALLTGKEAQLVRAGAEGPLRALRYGSSGELVSQLQSKLAAANVGFNVTPDGSFSRKTVGAVIRWQIANNLPTTAIIAKREADIMGLKLG
jgi:hypothetical protein